MQTNPLSQHSITGPEAIVLDTPKQKIPKSINGEEVKNSRKQATTSTTNTQDSRFCFRCKQPGHLKIVLSYPIALNAELKAISQRSVLPNNRMADSRTKDVKVPIKDAKLIEKIGKKHRTDFSSLTKPTNVLTVQATTERVIVQQGSNHMHPLLATLLMV